MKSAKYILLLGLGACVGSCGLYSRYDRQPGDIVGYDIGAIAPGDQSEVSLGSVEWQELFTDPYLRGWIEKALESNTDLGVARLKVEEASASLEASRMAFLPSVSAGVDGSTGTSNSSLKASVSAGWEIDVFGRLRNLKFGATAAYYASEEYSRAVKTGVISSVANSYYTLLMLDEQLDISERTLVTWNENIRALQALKRGGRTNEAAVLQARANRMRVENSAVTLRSQIKAQENAVKSLLLDPEADLSRGKLGEQNFPDTLSVGVAATLLANRPDVRQAEYELERCFYNVNVARAAFYPTLTLSGNGGWTTTSGKGIGSPSEWIGNFIGSLTAPLFNRGTNIANLKISKAEMEVASLNFQQRLLDAGMEVNNALTDWQTARDRLALDKKQIVALNGAVHNTRLLMRNTSATNYLEVLTAQQRLLEAELTEAQDRYNAIQAIISLYHALGGGVN